MKTKLFATGAVTVLSGAMALAASAGTTAIAAPQSHTFDYTGDAQTWVVPAGVTSATFDVWGAQGGDTADEGCEDIGGLGGHTTATITVTPGETITLVVGGRGGSSNTEDADFGFGGFNGGGDAGFTADDEVNEPTAGGGGGGASDVRTGGDDEADRVIVAGGGGGVGAACEGANDGGAGSGDSTTGGTGGEGSLPSHGVGGTGGASAAGGVGGAFGGTDGVLFQGGDGGFNSDHISAGGGGGGGYYGGGGGGAGIYVVEQGGTGGGGGGGGGLCPTTCVSAASGVRAGNGQITVSWSTADPAPAPANAVAGSPRFTG